MTSTYLVQKGNTNMKKLITITMVAVVSLISGSVALGGWIQPPSWDIIDSDFGDGAGEVSIYDAFPTHYYSSGTASETLSADMTRVEHSGAATWAWKNDITLTGNSFTFEVRFRQPIGHRVGFTVYGPDGTTAELDFKNPGDGSFSNISDDAGQDVDLGVDRSVMNSYRVVYDSVSDTLNAYLNGSGLAAGTINAPNKSTNTSTAWVNMADYHAGQFFEAEYFKVANGAWIPEPSTTLALLVLGGLTLARRRRSA